MEDSVQRRGDVQGAIARSRVRQAWAMIVLAAAVVAAFMGFRSRRVAESKVPATVYITVTAKSAGMVGQVMVQPGQFVRKGQLLAVMDYSHLEAEKELAEQNLMEALDQTTSSSEATALSPPPPALRGRFEKKAVPLPPVQTNNVNVAPPPPQQPLNLKHPLPEKKGPAAAGNKAPAATQKAPGTLPKVQTAAPTPVKTPSPTQSASKAHLSVKDAEAKVAADNYTIKSLTDKIVTDQDSVDQTQSLVVSLGNIATRTKADSDKSASLLAEGVISANEASKSQSYNMQAQGQLQQAKIKAAEAVSNLGDDQRTLDATKANLPKDMDAIKVAQVDASKPKIQPLVQSSPTPPAGSETSSAPAPRYKLESVPSFASSLPAKPLQVDFISLAQVLQKIAAAEKTLSDTQTEMAASCIYASATGTVTRVSVRSGQLLTKGEATFVIRK